MRSNNFLDIAASFWHTVRGGPMKHTIDDFEQAAKMYLSGVPMDEAARLRGTSRQAVYRYMARNGIPNRADISRGVFKTNRYNTEVQIEASIASREGVLSRPDTCSECSCTGRKIYGHHDDYTKPLDVRWLCQSCHVKWHKTHEAIVAVGVNPIEIDEGYKPVSHRTVIYDRADGTTMVFGYTVRQASIILGVSLRTLYRWLKVYPNGKAWQMRLIDTLAN